MKASDVLNLYANGRRDFPGENLRGQNFKGKDLSEADFSGCDIRGTNFKGANLTGAKFIKVKAGLQKRWMILLLFAALVLIVVSMILLGVLGYFVALIFDNSNATNRVVGWTVLATLITLCIVIYHQGIEAVAVVGAVAVAVAAAVAVAGTVAVVGAVAVAVAVAGTVAAAAALTLFASFISYRTIKGNPRDAWIRDLAVASAATGGTSFYNANLTNADFTGAILKNTDLRAKFLTRTCFKNTVKIDFSRVGKTLLSQPAIRDLLINSSSGYKKDYTKADLRGANLDGANLKEANLKQADLGEATLKCADLSHANLTEVNAVNTDFSHAYLTGACLESWNIDSTTILDNIDCQYVYLLEKPNQYGHRERRPHDPDKMFQAGDFEKLYKKVMNTVQLWLRNGDNPQAFAMALQQLMKDNPQAKFKSMEDKESDYLFSIEFPEETDKAQAERKFDEDRQNYLKSATNSPNSTEQLKLSEHQTLIFNIYINTEAKNMSNSSDKYQSKYDQRNANIGGIVDTAQPGSNPEFHQHNYATQNLIDAAKEIQELLERLSQTYPTNSTTEQMIVATKAIETIENNPTWKQKAIAACQQGLLEAMKTHPIGAFVVGAIEGWKQ